MTQSLFLCLEIEGLEWTKILPLLQRGRLKLSYVITEGTIQKLKQVQQDGSFYYIEIAYKLYSCAGTFYIKEEMLRGKPGNEYLN